MRFLLAIASVLLVCCAPKTGLNAVPPPAPGGPSWDQLQGAPYELIALKIKGKEAKLPEKPKQTVQFSEKNRVAGHAGVNRYSRTAEIGPGETIRWTGPAISTKMAGPPELMELETQFLAAIEECSRISMKGNTLVLSNADSSTLVVMKR